MSIAARNKRGNKVKEAETTKNNELRDAILRDIVKLCDELPDSSNDSATNKKFTKISENAPRSSNIDIQIIKATLDEPILRLKSLWGQHGFLLIKSTIGSDINIRDFLEAFFPTLNKGTPDVIHLAVSNFEFILDLSGESLIPHVKSLVAKVKHYAHDRLIFFKLMSMIVWRYGKWLDTYAEFDNYLKTFQEDKIIEALDLLAALINTCGSCLKQESLIKLLELLSVGHHLRTNTHYLKMLNELFPVCFPELPLREIVHDLLKKTQGRIFLDQEYSKELEKCRLLSITAFL